MNQIWTRYLPAFIRQRLEGRHDLLKAVGNTGWLIVDNIVRMGVGLLVSIWVTRYLGPEKFGLLSYASAFLILFTPAATLGLEGIVIRDIARDPLRRDEILGSAFFLKLVGGIATIILALVAITVLRPTDRFMQLLVFIASIGTIFQSLGVIDYWFVSQLQSKYAAYARSLACLVTSGIKIILILYHAPLIAFALAGVADIVIGSIGFVAVYRIVNLNPKDWRITQQMSLNLLRDSWPLLLADVVMLIYMRIDKVMIGEMVGNTELGIYSVAAMLTEALYFVPMAVNSSIYPSLVEAAQTADESFYNKVQLFYNLMAFIAYIIIIPASIIAPWAIPIVFGHNYNRAGLMFAGLVWGGLFFNLAFARGSFLAIMNWTRIQFIVDFTGCVLNIILNILLIPRYGGFGAVIATMVSYWFVAHGACFLFQPLRKTGVMITKAIVCPKFW
jgi:O-antigen/teichoic acid export membrane protein